MDCIGTSEDECTEKSFGVEHGVWSNDMRVRMRTQAGRNKGILTAAS
ncbi:histone deacetylase 8, partial [Moniliophthora roreri]